LFRHWKLFGILENEMPFMQKQIYYGSYFEIDTTAGTEIVPQDISGDVADVSELRDYLEGTPLYDEFGCGTGWLARMSAPGYLDCTPWGAYRTEDQAHDALDDMYGED
jgi:hypothetical protein